MIIYGFISQNIIALYAGYISKEEHAPLLIFFRKICGLVLWPQIFHMQKNLKEIQVATKNRKEFFRYFIEYLSLIKNQLIGYSLLSVTIGLIAIYYMDFLTPYSLIAFLIVLITTLVNLVFGYMKYQVGTTKNGVIFFLAMIISIILIYFMQMTSYINYVSIALVFLFYTSFNHISVFILLSKKLKGEQ